MFWNIKLILLLSLCAFVSTRPQYYLMRRIAPHSTGSSWAPPIKRFSYPYFPPSNRPLFLPGGFMNERHPEPEKEENGEKEKAKSGEHEEPKGETSKEEKDEKEEKHEEKKKLNVHDGVPVLTSSEEDKLKYSLCGKGYGIDYGFYGDLECDVVDLIY